MIAIHCAVSNVIVVCNLKVDIETVQAKLKQLEQAVVNHRVSMQEIEQLALGNNDHDDDVDEVRGRKKETDTDAESDDLHALRPNKKFHSGDNEIHDEGLSKFKVCSASFGIEEAAKSKLDVRILN